jgi:hypothetical protein
MAIYSIHSQGTGLEQNDEPRFLYEGFSWRAFFFGPFWLIWNGLFVALAVWTVLFAGLSLASAFALSEDMSFVAFLLLQALLGLEANHLLELKWQRKGYRLIDIAAAKATEDAEILFFRRAGAASEAATQAEKRRAAVPTPSPHPDILGSFPNPEARR